MKLVDFYNHKYKRLVLIPVVLFAVSALILAGQFAATGQFFERDISLKGGVTMTILYEEPVDTEVFRNQLTENSGVDDLSIRILRQAGAQRGIVVDAGVEDPEVVDGLRDAAQALLGVPDEQVNTQVIGSTLGADFFRQAILAVGLAFLLMGLVVIVYFRSIVPSFIVIIAAAGDIASTMAAISLLDVKVSTAGFAAFLMLIGFSVDTDILLTTRMLRGKEESLFHRIMAGFRTGITMTMTALIGMLVAFIFTQSDTIRQIMLVLVIGLFFDLIYTWLGNALILRWWLERKGLR